jgi:hypothetical protein
MSEARKTEHRASVARWTTCLLCGCLALEAGTMTSRLAQRPLLAALAATQPLPDDAAANYFRQRADAQARALARYRAIGALKLLVLAGTAIVWLTWLHGAYQNRASVGTQRSRFSPAWSAAYWFIPFINVVRAYQVMKDLWLRSDSPNDRDAYDTLPAPDLLRGWWGTSVAWGVLAPVVGVLAQEARTPQELTNLTDLGMVVNVIGVIAGVLAIRVVREIDAQQRALNPATSEAGAGDAARRPATPT